MSSSPEQDIRSQSNPGSKPKKWTRMSGRKVKTGCRTCKIRRIKCDEQKPECLRCQMSGRKCDGYAQNETSTLRVPQQNDDARKRRSPSIGQSSEVSPVLSSINLPIIVNITGEQYELRAFHRYRVKTADDLSGSFPSNFWSRLVPQLAHVESAVKHALIAVSIAHENYQSSHAGTDLVDGDAALDLRQYQKAISYLNQHLSVPSKHNAEVALICCALFICFEGLRGDYDAALIHLQSGIDIIKSWKTLGERRSQSEVPYLDPDTDGDELIEFFTRLDFSASAFVPERPPQMTPRQSHFGNNKAFRNLLEARQALERLFNRTMLLLIRYHSKDVSTVESNPRPSVEQNILLSAVSSWSIRFDNLLKSSNTTNLEGKNLIGAFTLIMHKKTLGVMLQTCHTNVPSVLSQFSDDIESIISIGAFIASPGTKSPDKKGWLIQSRSSGPPIFTSDMGIIAPLYYILMESRDPDIRERAINILAETRRREGIWDSQIIARIGANLIPLGENLTSAQGSVLWDGEIPDIAIFLNGNDTSETM